MTQTWFRLLEQHRLDGRFGLTPSFLVGAMRNPPGAGLDEPASFVAFRSMLESMRDETPKGYYIRVAECPSLHQAVVAALSGSPPDTGSGEQVVLSPSGSASSLFAWPQYFSTPSRDIESLAAALWEVFGAPIRERRFSYRSGAFHPFDADDLKFIKRALDEAGA